MNEILEYISANYTWILGGMIIILLAIIGSYADKTNFGQGKQEDNIDNSNEDLLQNNMQNVRINDFLNDKKSENEISENQVLETIEVDNNFEENNSFQDNDKVENNNFEENFEKLNQEVEEALPEKEVVDGELLDEIDNLSLDKTQKIKLNDIPDLDDVELPKIKDLKSTDDDVWKF